MSLHLTRSLTLFSRNVTSYMLQFAVKVMDLISYRTFELCTHTMRPVLSGSKQVTEGRKEGGREIKDNCLLHMISTHFIPILASYASYVAPDMTSLSKHFEFYH